MRRVLVVLLAIPYFVVMFPYWAVRDFSSAFRAGWRRP